MVAKKIQTKVSVRAQLKDALQQLWQAREEIQKLRSGVHSPSRPSADLNVLSDKHFGLHCSKVLGSSSLVNNTPPSIKSGRVYHAALPHPLAVIPGTKQAAAFAAKASVFVGSNPTCAVSSTLVQSESLTEHS
jgi:hypothetical protein